MTDILTILAGDGTVLFRIDERGYQSSDIEDEDERAARIAESFRQFHNRVRGSDGIRLTRPDESSGHLYHLDV